jgi:sugar/nucleoside kinase (ribokinase family)
VETLFANTDEAQVLAGTDDPDLQLAILSARYSVVVLKRGAGGAVALARGGAPVSTPAPAIAAIDTTGAGDAFLAAFLHARLSGAALAECLAAGVALGARAAMLLGGRPPDGAGAGLRDGAIGG